MSKPLIRRGVYMIFSDIKPFARFSRELVISSNSTFSESYPIDARFFYVFEGRLKISAEGKIINLSRGSAILINSGVPYRFIPDNAKILAVNFDWTQDFCKQDTPIHPMPYKSGAHGLSTLEEITFDDVRELNRYAYCENAFSVENPLWKMIDRNEKNMPYYKLENNAEFTLVLTEFVRQLSLRKTNNFDANSVADYLKSHYNEEISNQKIAEIFHFHPNYISGEFRRTFGKPLHRYLLELRITKALALLETGQYTTKAVANAVGFNDVNYFTRYFKKMTGKTPTSIYS